jgi:hypothetical protein
VLGRRQRSSHRRAPGDEGDVATGARDGRLADRHEVLAVGQLVARVPQREALDDDDGVGVADGGLQQALHVRGVRGPHDLEAGDVGEPALEALPVLRARVAPRAAHRAQNHGNAELAAGDRRDLGSVVDQLIGGERHEVHEHDLDDGAQAGHRRAGGHADEQPFADRGVADALRAEAVEQPLRGDVGAAGLADVLADHDDAGIALHLLGQRIVDRLPVFDLRHDVTPQA